MTLSAPGCSLEPPHPELKDSSHCWFPQTHSRLNFLAPRFLEWSAMWVGKTLWKRRVSGWLSL